MRFDQALHAKLQAQQIKPPLEYPKYIHVEGKSVLVQSAEEERSFNGPEEAAENDSAVSTDNLLSEPEKRPRGRPVGWRKPVLVDTDPKE